MNEEKPKRGQSDNRTGAYILIGFGVLFLVNSFLRINLWQLWPLLLIGVGVYMLYGRNAGFSSTAKHGMFSEPLNDAQSARVDLHLSAGSAIISPLTDSATLIDAELTYVGDVDFQVMGDTEKRVTLKQGADAYIAWLNPANWFNGQHGGLPWNIHLSPAVPMVLNVHGGAGEANLDLRPLQISELNYSAGVGRTDINLPAESPTQQLDARISGGVGEVRVAVPSGLSARLDVKGGVGEITIDPPPNAAIRIHANSGIGDVNLPSRLVRIEGGDTSFGQSGIWESADYAQAATRIDIDYNGGIGELTLR